MTNGNGQKIPGKFLHDWNPLRRAKRLEGEGGRRARPCSRRPADCSCHSGRCPGKLTLMKRMLVRYKTRPEKIEENERLIQNVFQELGVRSPEGLRYAVLKLADGTFIHLVENEAGVNPLLELEAFRAFSSTIKERCIEPPQFGDAEIVGNYRLIGEG
jgi:hypothetical protein